MTRVSRLGHTLAFVLPLALAAGCADLGFGGGSTGGAKSPDKAEQALATAKDALAQAKAARAAADQALTEAREAQATAQQALQTAKAGGDAKALAEQALSASANAQQMATEALRVAGDAKIATDRLDDKTNRMFRKSQMK
jgi:hypothetical protein